MPRKSWKCRSPIPAASQTVQNELRKPSLVQARLFVFVRICVPFLGSASKNRRSVSPHGIVTRLPVFGCSGWIVRPFAPRFRFGF